MTGGRDGQDGHDVLALLTDAAVGRVTVTAPAGYGKTALLIRLARLLTAAGRTVETNADLIDDPRPDTRPAVLLVDDAHLLGPAGVHAVRGLAERGRQVVLTRRAWPRSPALDTLLGDLPGPAVKLRPLTQAQATGLLGTGRELPVGRLHHYTGGVPRYLDWIAAASATGPDAARRHAAERLAVDLNAADTALVRYLVATDVCGSGDLGLLGDLLGTDPAGVADMAEAARACALVDSADATLPISVDAVRLLTTPTFRNEVLHRLAELRLRARLPVHDIATELLDGGATGPAAVAVYAAAGREHADRPADAARMFAAAAHAGADTTSFAGEWAVAAASSGDVDTALRLSDTLILSGDLDERATGATVAATVYAHRAELARSAELATWAGNGSARHHAVVALIGTGRRDEARMLLTSAADHTTAITGATNLTGPAAPTTTAPTTAPTTAAVVATRMALGIEQTLSAPPGQALSTLLGAAALADTGRGGLMPDSPAALAAIVALHSGEPDLADSVLDRALATGGRDVHTTRHETLRAWVAMTRGDQHDTAQDPQPTPLRDEVFRAALAAGLARRDSDLAALRRTWPHAYQTVMRVQVDLYLLLPLGELLVAAARLGEHRTLATHLHNAVELLDRLGDPPLWSVSFHWSRLHSAIHAGDTGTAQAQVRSLEHHATFSRHSAALAAAGRCWLDVLAGGGGPGTVIAAAEELHAVGLRWDAARLAGQAALRTPDKAAMVDLLEAARRFQGGRRHSPVTAIRRADVLSEREQEVARLVADGMTYKQVGSALFISGKTVEHHVAKIRTKLGATSRHDLLRTLREFYPTG